MSRPRWSRSCSGCGASFCTSCRKGDENAFPTPRSLTKAAEVRERSESSTAWAFRLAVGDAPAAELDGFIELYRALGSLDDIVADPVNAKVPTEPSTRYAVCTGLGRIATRQNFPNDHPLCQAAECAKSEILIVTDATGRDANLKNIAAYGKWAVDNQDLTIQ